MKQKKHICFIVPGYPTKEEPVFTFIRQLISTIANLGIKCSVIAPSSISKSFIRKTDYRKSYWQDITKEGNKIDIYQPKILSFSNFKFLGVSITSYIQQKAVIKAFNKIGLKPDIIYGHFWDNGLTAAIIGDKYDIPTYVATGESKINVQNKYPRKFLNKYLKNIKGVIAVSTKNKNESIELNLASEDIIDVIPNAVDDNVFYPINKLIAREELGFNKDDYIVAFTGAFIHRKGILRLSEALKKIENVKAIYIGSGDLEPEKDNALHVGSLPHEKIPLYLNAADVFVLPTLAEGASNAIIEAMACGLPIISSDESFNDDILFPDNSLRINSADVGAIRNAIVLLRDNPELREDMSVSSLKYAQSFRIEYRAKKILNFMNVDIQTTKI